MNVLVKVFLILVYLLVMGILSRLSNETLMLVVRFWFAMTLTNSIIGFLGAKWKEIKLWTIRQLES